MRAEAPPPPPPPPSAPRKGWGSAYAKNKWKNNFFKMKGEGGCRDGVNYEKEYQQEDASIENKNHTFIPTSFFNSQPRL